MCALAPSSIDELSKLSIFILLTLRLKLFLHFRTYFRKNVIFDNSTIRVIKIMRYRLNFTPLMAAFPPLPILVFCSLSGYLATRRRTKEIVLSTLCPELSA